MAVSRNNAMPDLISSSVEMHNDDFTPSKAAEISDSIHISSQRTGLFMGLFKNEIFHLVKLPEAQKILGFLAFNLLSNFLLLVWCHKTNSIALTAFSNLMVFDALSLLTCLLSVWVQQQQPSAAYTFGYDRFEVVAVFASTMLAQLGSLFIIKESLECFLQQPEIQSAAVMAVGTVFGLAVHLAVLFCVNNRAMDHVTAASTSSWLQEHTADVSKSVCSVVPALSKLLLPRLNPMVLLGFTSCVAILISYIVIDKQLYHTADTWAAIAIAVMTWGTMFPMGVYTGTILLQTTPGHVLGQLDKLLREASTLDGVLEFRNEHFWTLSFGTLAGSVHVRVRRDADEQLVLAHVYSRLSQLVQLLTVQTVKDDWMTRVVALPALDSSTFTPTMAQHADRSTVPPPADDPTASYQPPPPPSAPSTDVGPA